MIGGGGGGGGVIIDVNDRIKNTEREREKERNILTHLINGTEGIDRLYFAIMILCRNY